MPIREVNLEVKVPFVGIGTKWVPNDTEQRASWELLVELVTRTSVTPLRRAEGILREALTSLYKLFDLTRDVLKRHGPDVAKDKGNGNPSLATISAVILNGVLRPVLSKWHPMLTDHEAKNDGTYGKAEWERRWDRHDELRETLNDVRQQVRLYVEVLGEAAEATEFAAAVVPRRRDG